MKNKGFTLVEVLAMLVVLGILMAVTIPNITGIVNQHKTNAIKSDVTKMVDSAKIKMSTDDDVKKPKNGQCVVFSLDYLNYNKDIGDGPHDGIYLDYDSFVIVKREGKAYKYYVRLVEKTEDGLYGVSGVDSELITQESDNNIGPVDKELGIIKNDDPTILAEFDVIKNYCTSASNIIFFK